MAYNPIGEGLAGLGKGLGQMFGQQRQEAKLGGLLQGVQSGDQSALMELAATNPQVAQFLMSQQRMGMERSQFDAQQQKQQRDQRHQNVGIIAQTALGITDPTRRRVYLMERLKTEQDPEIKAEIADSLNMDDDQLAYDLQEAVSQWSGYREPKQEDPLSVQSTVTGEDGVYAVMKDGTTRNLGITPQPRGRGMSVTLPDGTTFSMGGAGPGLQTQAVKEVEKELLDTSKTMGMLTQAEQIFNPDDQTLLSNAKSLGVNLKSIAGLDLSDKEKAAEARKITQRAMIGKVSSQIRNQLFGAALTDAERKSANAFLPDVEQDSPVQLETKFRLLLEQSKQAVARLNYIRKRGDIGMEDVPLESMPQVIQQRGTEIYEGLIQQGMDPAQAEQQARTAVAQEFGLVGR